MPVTTLPPVRGGRGESLRSGTVPNRRLVSLTVAVAAACLATIACSPGDAFREQSAAVRVDDATIPRSHFEDQLDLVYENEDLRGYLFAGVARDQLRADDAPVGTYTQQYAGAMAGLHVQFLVAAQVLDAEGIEVSADDRAAVVADLDQVLAGGADALPDEARDDLVDGLAAFGRLRAEFDQAELGDLVNRFVDEATIVVNTRYGTWDGEMLSVRPPDGPAQAPGGGGDAEPSLG